MKAQSHTGFGVNKKKDEIICELQLFTFQVNKKKYKEIGDCGKLSMIEIVHQKKCKLTLISWSPRTDPLGAYGHMIGVHSMWSLNLSSSDCKLLM